LTLNAEGFIKTVDITLQWIFCRVFVQVCHSFKARLTMESEFSASRLARPTKLLQFGRKQSFVRISCRCWQKLKETLRRSSSSSERNLSRVKDGRSRRGYRREQLALQLASLRVFLSEVHASLKFRSAVRPRFHRQWKQPLQWGYRLPGPQFLQRT